MHSVRHHKRLFLLGIILLFSSLLIALVPVTSSAPRSQVADQFLQASGANLMYQGQKVVLKGTNFDNIGALGAGIGSGNVDDIYFSEADYAELNRHGGNHVRLGLSFNWYQQDKQRMFLRLDEQVSWARKHGIWLVFNMFTTPGDCYEGYGNVCGFWNSANEQQQLLNFWVDMAMRYRTEPAVAGYDLLNEPTPATNCTAWFPIAGRIQAAVAAVAPKQLVFIETCSDPGNDLRYNKPPRGTNIVYEVHDYAPMDATHDMFSPGSVYPGVANEWFGSCYYDKSTFTGGNNCPQGDIRETHGLNWARENNVPIYIGEWGATSVLNGYVRYHQDKAELYRDWGVNHAHYTWKHQTIKTGGYYQWGIYSQPLNLDDPAKLEAVKIAWQGAARPNFGGTTPTAQPTTIPQPTIRPTSAPTAQPATPVPTVRPTFVPTSVPTMPPTPISTSGILRIDAGAASGSVDTAGNSWVPDVGFADGQVIDRGNISIENTTNDRLYQTERYAMTAYRIAVPNGNYTVKLGFAETYTGITSAGQRVFGVNVEGQELGNIDVFAFAGGINRAWAKEVATTVSDGQLTITFAKQIEQPEINTIEVLPFTTPAATPPPVVPSAQLTATYFNDTNGTQLTNVVTTRSEQSIDFAWQNGSPDSRVTSDNFSARWVGTVTAPTSGQYSFITTSDDGVRLKLDGQIVIDNWTDHPATDNNATLFLSAGQQVAVVMEYYERGGGAVARLSWQTPSSTRQVIPASAWSNAAPVTTGTIEREFWRSTTLALADLQTTTTPPSGVEMLTSFESPVNWSSNYLTRIRGYLVPPTTGLYVFWLTSDDYGKLFLSSDASPLNKRQIAFVDGWTNSREWQKYPSQRSTAIQLVAGQRYYIEATSSQWTGGDNLAVAWAKPGQDSTKPSEILPGAVLAEYK